MKASRSLALLLLTASFTGCGKATTTPGPDASLTNDREECQDHYRFCLWYGASCGVVPEEGYFLACSIKRAVDCGVCGEGLACGVVTRNWCGCPKTASGPCGSCNPGEESSPAGCRCAPGSCPDGQTCHQARCIDRPAPAVCADDAKVCAWFGTCGAVAAEDWTAACPDTPNRSLDCPCPRDGGFDYDAGP